MTRLVDLQVLALDCQATGATPQKGRLLEIGWSAGCSAAADDVAGTPIRTFVIAGTQDLQIPKTVQKITGITEHTLLEAVDEAAVWRQLSQTAAAIAAASGSAMCPTVIHYARFETPFLHALHYTYDPQQTFPFQLICTHAIAARLLPALPRRGLRALAGFFGHTVPEQRRSGAHVLATLFIWRKLVCLLSSRLEIDTLSDLLNWLATEPVTRAAERTFPMNPRQLRHLPDGPGVYCMRRGNGDLLYVGKAKSLKTRVHSYFRPRANHAEHILEMLTQALEVEFTPTASALEAALREAEMIQQQDPPYNRALRDDRRQPVFFSRDLMSFRHIADPVHCLGPLPENQTGDALVYFSTWLTRHMSVVGEALQTATAMLNLPGASAPDPDCISAGLQRFQEQYGRRLEDRPILRALIGLGAQFWAEHLVDIDVHDEEIDDQATENGHPIESQPEWTWTPEAIEHLIKGRLRHWALLLRRARFYGLLCESSLAWSANGSADEDRHLIILAAGRIADRATLPGNAPLPVPPNHGLPLMERLTHMDMSTYHRLRVLTTELRRILTQDRRMELRLAPGACLSNLSLGCLLRWL